MDEAVNTVQKHALGVAEDAQTVAGMKNEGKYFQNRYDRMSAYFLT